MAVPIAAVLILGLLFLYLVEKRKDKAKDTRVVPAEDKIAAMKAELEQEIENLQVIESLKVGFVCCVGFAV